MARKIAARRQDDDADIQTPPLANTIFAGDQAAAVLAQQGVTGPQSALAHARLLQRRGVDARTIHAETSRMLEGTPYAGVHFGADGKPRFEISDKSAITKPFRDGSSLGDVLRHDELYKAHPEAQFYGVKRMRGRGAGFDGRSVYFGDNMLSQKPLGGHIVPTKDARGAALHELQHHVQDREHFAIGGDPRDYEGRFPGKTNEGLRYELYRHLAGEQEAEMTRARGDMSAAERRATPPKPSIPFDDQIVTDADVRRVLRDIYPRMKVGGASVPELDSAKIQSFKQSIDVDGRKAAYKRLDPRKIKTDADQFQFKSGGDTHGVTDRLKSVKKWDDLSAGKVVVFERKDGSHVIADGHQRRGLALRAIEAGQKGVKMDAYVFREKDGWKPKDVRAIAAMKNIREDSGSSLDMAKVMRDRPDLVDATVPLASSKVREARGLANLSPDAFGMAASGAVKPEIAAAVGEAVRDEGRHADLLREMAKAKVASGQHARLYVGQALAAPSINETSHSLFGTETQQRSLLAERAAVLNKAMDALRSDKRIFGMLQKEAGTVEAAGNTLAKDANAQRASEAHNLTALVEKLAATRGPVSDMLNRAAVGIANGQKPTQAARGFVTDLRSAMKAGGVAGLTGERSGWSDAARSASADVRGQNKMQMMFGGDLPKGYVLKKTASRKIGPERRNEIQFEVRQRGKHYPVATYQVRDHGNGQASVDSALVDRAHRRKGISTAVYGEIERRMGVKLTPSKTLLGDGAAFWKHHEPQALANHEQGARGGMYYNDPALKKSIAEVFSDAQSSMFSEPTTKDKLSARSRSLQAKGRLGDAMTDGLFGDSHKQKDLVDMAKAKTSAPKKIPAIVDRARSVHVEEARFSDGLIAINEDAIKTPAQAKAFLKERGLPTTAAAYDRMTAAKAKSAEGQPHAITTKPPRESSSGLHGTQNPSNQAAIQGNKSAPTGPMTVAQMKAHVKANGIRVPATTGAPSKVVLARAIAAHHAGSFDNRSGIESALLAKSPRKPKMQRMADRPSIGKAVKDMFHAMGEHGNEIRAKMNGEVTQKGRNKAAESKYGRILDQVHEDGKISKAQSERNARAKANPGVVPPAKMQRMVDEPPAVKAAKTRAASVADKYVAKDGTSPQPKAKRTRDGSIGMAKQMARAAKMGVEVPEHIKAIGQHAVNGWLRGERSNRAAAKSTAKAAPGQSTTIVDSTSGTRTSDSAIKSRRAKSGPAKMAKAAQGLVNQSAPANVVGVDEAKPSAESRTDRVNRLTERMAANGMSTEKAKATAEASVSKLEGKTTSGLRGTQNASNLAAIKANKNAKAVSSPSHGGTRTPDGKYFPNINPNSKLGRAFADPKRSAHAQKAWAESVSQLRVVTDGINDVAKSLRGFSDALGGKPKMQRMAEPPTAPTSEPRNLASKTMTGLGVASILASGLKSANEAKAQGTSQMKAAIEGGATSAAGLAGFAAATHVATLGTAKVLAKVGVSAARASPIVQAGLIGVGAVSGAINAKPGERLKGAAKGAWDMSLPGMAINTAKEVHEAVSGRLNGAAPTSGNQMASKFEQANSQFAPQAQQSSDDQPKRKGYANPIVQAKVQAKRGREFHGFKNPALKS